MILAGLAIVLLGISVFVFRSGGRHYLANPLVAFFGIWAGVLLLGRLAHFNIELTSAGLRLTGVAFLALALGGIAGVWLWSRRAFTPVNAQLGVRPIMFVALASLPLFAICVAWKFGLAWSVVGMPFAHVQEIRTSGLAGELATPLVIRGMVVFGYLAALNLGVLWAVRPSRVVLALSLTLGALLFLNDLSIGARGSLFNGGLLMASAEVVAGAGRSRGVWRVAHAIGIAVVATLAASTIFWLRSSNVEEAPSLEVVARSAATYATGAVPASGWFLDNPWPTQVPGHWSFAGFWQLADAFSAKLDLPTQTFWAPGGFNTGTFITYFYSDFGIPGVIILSALTGLAAGYLFIGAARTRRLGMVELAALALFTLAFTPRGFIWSGMVFWPLTVVVIAQPFLLRLASRIRLSRRPALAPQPAISGGSDTDCQP